MPFVVASIDSKSQRPSPHNCHLHNVAAWATSYTWLLEQKIFYDPLKNIFPNPNKLTGTERIVDCPAGHSISNMLVCKICQICLSGKSLSTRDECCRFVLIMTFLCILKDKLQEFCLFPSSLAALAPCNLSFCHWGNGASLSSVAA